MIDEIKILLSVISGALTAGIPLYFKIRSMNLKLKEREAEIDAKIADQTSKQKHSDEIDKEAAWKRILDMREAEIEKLQRRDDAQEVKLDRLNEQHIQCQRNEAAMTERVKANEDRIRFLEEKILTLLQLALTGKQSNVGQNPQQGPSGTQAG